MSWEGVGLGGISGVIMLTMGVVGEEVLRESIERGVGTGVCD